MKKFIFQAKILFIPCQENSYKPRFLESEFLFYFVLSLLVLKLIAVSFILYFPKTIFFADLTKTALVELTNQERKTLGIPTLNENPKLDQAAYQKAQDMLSFDYFSHWSPTGVSPWYWFKKADYSYRLAGENLAIGFLDSEEVVQAWINSPSHRANLFNSNFQEIGIAVLKGDFQGSESTVVVQLFGSPVKETPKSTETKTTEEKKIVEKEKPSEITPTPEVTISPSPEIIPTPTEVGTPPQEIAEEEQKEIATGVVASEFQFTAPKPEIENTSFKFNFFKFMMLTYPDILQKLIFYSLLLVMLAFALNIFIKIQIQDRRLIFRATTFIALLILFAITDKELIIQFIPHSLLI